PPRRSPPPAGGPRANRRAGNERAQRGRAGGARRCRTAGGAGEAQAGAQGGGRAPGGGGQRRGGFDQSHRQHRGTGPGARGLLVRGRRAGPVPVAAQVGRHPAAALGPEVGGDLLRWALDGAQRRGAARRHQRQDLPGEARRHHRAPQGHHDPPARNRVYGAGVRFRAAGEPAARQAGGNAMKRIAALIPFLLVLTLGASPGITGGAARDGEVKAVSVLPAARSVEVVIDLDVLKDYQIERRAGQVRAKIGTERTAFAAWSSQSVARAVAPAPALRMAERRSGGEVGGAQAARVATPAASGPELSIDAYL